MPIRTERASCIGWLIIIGKYGKAYTDTLGTPSKWKQKPELTDALINRKQTPPK